MEQDKNNRDRRLSSGTKKKSAQRPSKKLVAPTTSRLVEGLNPLKGKPFIALVRQSSDADGTTSTEAQLNFLKEDGIAQGMIFVDAVVLKGVTGSHPGRRTDLDDLFKRKRERNDFDVISVQIADRMTRGGMTHAGWIEHECNRHGIILRIAGEDLPSGPWANMIKMMKYEGAKEQARTISMRSVQGAVLAMDQDRNSACSNTPFGCYRFYHQQDGTPLFLIRNLGDGRQEKLNPQTREVIDVYGSIGGKAKGHYRKQKTERTLIAPGDPEQADAVRQMFRLYWVEGWRGKRVANWLNERGILSPRGKLWSQNQVDSICMNPVFCGWSLGQRISSALFHQRAAGKTEPVYVDPIILASQKRIPIRRRSPEDWLWRPEPYMEDFLPPEVGDLALSKIKQARIEEWERSQTPGGGRRPASKHRPSAYILSKHLTAKQDDGAEPLVGHLSGPADKKVRYYRHVRGNRDYQKGSVFNKMVPAEPLERQLLATISEIMRSAPDLRGRIERIVEQQQRNMPTPKSIDDLRVRRQAIADRALQLAQTFGEESMADIKPELDRLNAERRAIDEQIALAEELDIQEARPVAEVVDAVVARLGQLADQLDGSPPALLKDILGAMVSRLTVDLETKNVEAYLQIPPWASLKGDQNLFLGRGSSSSTESEEQAASRALARIICEYNIQASRACYRCRRAA